MHAHADEAVFQHKLILIAVEITLTRHRITPDLRPGLYSFAAPAAGLATLAAAGQFTSGFF
jgi:hypothetical protein